MFERARLGGALYNACSALEREGTRVDRHKLRDVTDPFMDVAIAKMRQLKLSPDQAAAAMIINLVNTLHHEGLLKKLYENEYDRFRAIFHVYSYFFGAAYDRPDHFKLARVSIDDDVFSAIMMLSK